MKRRSAENFQLHREAVFEQGEEFSARGRISGREQDGGGRPGAMGRRALVENARKTAWDQIVARSAGWAPASAPYESMRRTFTIFLPHSSYNWEQQQL